MNASPDNRANGSNIVEHWMVEADQETLDE
jgi:hypothetical protein